MSCMLVDLSILTCVEEVLVKGVEAGMDVRFGMEAPGISELDTARLPPSTALGKGPATSLLLEYVTKTYVQKKQLKHIIRSYASDRLNESPSGFHFHCLCLVCRLSYRFVSQHIVIVSIFSFKSHFLSRKPSLPQKKNFNNNNMRTCMNVWVIMHH